MLSVRLSGDVLHVKIESHLKDTEFKHLTKVFNSFERAFYWQEKYTWIIPKQFIDEIVAFMGEDRIAWYNSLEEIKGIRRSVIPTFQVSEEGLSDMLLPPYPFQGVGISFLYDVKQALLADEMGLGKSPQAIGASHRLWKNGLAKKVLVVCPTSLKYQWQEEISKFTNHKGIVIDGTPKARNAQLNSFASSDEYLFGIINYELVRNHLEFLQSLSLDVIIADECHRIKNHKTKTSEAMKYLDAPYKFGLTGTPMQNKPDELWNVMDWLDPTVLGSYWAFRNRYVVTAEKFGKRNVEIGYKRLGELRSRISQKMLRRMKVDVAKDLPQIIPHYFRVEMSPAQRRLHDAIQEDFLELVREIQAYSPEGYYNEKGEWVQPEHPKQSQLLGYFNLLMAVSDSPELLLMSDSAMAGQYLDLIGDKPVSPKLDELERICQDAMESNKNKVVVFTQFTRMQRLAVERLSKLGGVQVLNGSMKPYERQAAVTDFKFNDKINFFVTTDAGNFGLNLQFAQMLIHLDLPWNPAVKDQRDGRIHRIGSTFDSVDIVHLITRDGIDEKIEETLYRKRELAGQIVEKNEQERDIMNQLSSGLMSQIVGGKKKKVRKG